MRKRGGSRWDLVAILHTSWDMDMGHRICTSGWWRSSSIYLSPRSRTLFTLSLTVEILFLSSLGAGILCSETRQTEYGKQLKFSDLFELTILCIRRRQWVGLELTYCAGRTSIGLNYNDEKRDLNCYDDHGHLHSKKRFNVKISSKTSCFPWNNERVYPLVVSLVQLPEHFTKIRDSVSRPDMKTLTDVSTNC